MTKDSVYLMFSTDNIENIGGKSVQAKILLEELKALNLNIYVIQIPPKLDFLLVLLPLFILNKLNKGLGHLYAINMRSFLLAIIALFNSNKKGKNQVVLSQDAYGHQLYIKIYKALGKKIKTYLIIHSLGSVTYEAVKDNRLLEDNWITKRSLQKEINAYKQADKLIVVSQAAKVSLLEHLKNMEKNGQIEKKIRVINNGIKKIIPNQNNLLFKYDFCCVATLKPIKGHGTLIDAVALLKKDFPNLKIAVIGSGKMLPSLKKQAEKNDVIDNINFLGAKPRNEIFNILNESKYFVLPSLQENFSISLIEAAFHGLPIVASNVGGNSEIIDHKKTGYLFKVNDCKSLAEGMKWLMCNSNRNLMSKLLQDRANKEWTSNVMGIKYLNELEK